VIDANWPKKRTIPIAIFYFDRDLDQRLWSCDRYRDLHRKISRWWQPWCTDNYFKIYFQLDPITKKITYPLGESFSLMDAYICLKNVFLA
jgi:hypothetical protein